MSEEPRGADSRQEAQGHAEPAGLPKPAEPVPGARSAMDGRTAPGNSPVHRRIALLQLALAYAMLVPVLIGIFYWIILIVDYGSGVLLSAPIFLVFFLLFYWYHLLFAGNLPTSRAQLYWTISAGYHLLLAMAFAMLITRSGAAQPIILAMLVLFTLMGAGVILGILGFNAARQDDEVEGDAGDGSQEKSN